MTYITPIENLIQSLLTKVSKLSVNNIRFDAHEPFQNLPNQPLQIVVRSISNVPNPKYARDEISFAIQVLGRDKSKKMDASDLSWEICNVLTASDNIIVGDRTLYNMKALTQPSFVGFYDNNVPVFAATYDFITEYSNGIGNRVPLD